MFLLDTVVISELRKQPRRRDANVVRWLETVRTHDLFLSVLTVGEIEREIAQERQSDTVFSEQLAAWLDLLVRTYGGRILPVTVNIARRWGRLSHQVGNKGLDLAIAATALEHDLTVVTRNVTHFTSTGVVIINPFEPASL